jgi:uncharacterized protein (DUF488 family)
LAGSPLHTIGYEKAGVPAFLETLQAAGVQHVIDIRDLPLSRRAGFSKTPLRNGLAAAGIGYTHLKPLGTPPEGREANKRRQWPAFWQIVEARLQTPEARHALHQATTLASETPSALLCYESNPCTCHRLRVGQLMCEAYDFDLIHLTVQPP